MMHWVVRAAGLIVLLGGLWLTAAGVSDGVATATLVTDGQEATGHVLRLEPGPSDVGVVTVIGMTPPGQDAMIELRDGPHSVTSRAVGDAVRLIMPRDRPQAARINELSALWSGPALRVLGGLGAIAVGIAMMLTAGPDRQRRMRVPLVLRIALFGLAAGTTAIAWDNYSRVVDSLNRFPRGEGRVIALDGGAPRVLFVTGDGVTIEFVDKTVPAGRFEIDDHVVVGYSKASPTGARIERFDEVWGSSARWAAVSGLCILVFLYTSTWRRRIEQMAPAEPETPPPPTGPGLMARTVHWGSDSWRRLRRERRDQPARVPGDSDIELR